MKFDRKNPYGARLLDRVRLSVNGSRKDVYRLIFDIGDIHYECGDVLAVYPQNNISEVETILPLLHLKESEQVEIDGINYSIDNALVSKFCITHLTKRFLDAFQGKLTGVNRDRFEKFFLGENEDQYSLCELLNIFQCVEFSVDELSKLLKKMPPRMYSIASSQHLSGNKLRLIVGTISYENFLGHRRFGVASTYLNKHMKIGDHADVYVINSSFKMPKDCLTDMIMVGPGTGLAPFMSFMHELEFQRKASLKCGKSWLFFGDQHENLDFLERDEITRLQNDGVLTNLDLAFSRDQVEKIYVQTRMWEKREELWQWVSNGAHFYVCGDRKMATDVETIFQKIAMEVGRINEQSMDRWFSELKSAGRFQMDIY